MNGASAALGLSPLPFQGPIGSVRLGQVDGQFVPFPTQDELEESDLDLIVSGSQDAVLMIEGFAREMPEDRMVEAIMSAHGSSSEICDLQLELFAKVKVKRRSTCPAARRPVRQAARASTTPTSRQAKQTAGKHARADAVSGAQAAGAWPS